MKKILLLFVLFSCMACFGMEIPELINNQKDIASFENVNWGPYIKSLEDKIRQNIDLQNIEETDRVVARFAILKDGTLADVKIIEKSQKSFLNKAVKKAIRKVSPYDELPSSYVGDFLPVKYTFDYNTINSKGHAIEFSTKEFHNLQNSILQPVSPSFNILQF